MSQAVPSPSPAGGDGEPSELSEPGQPAVGPVPDGGACGPGDPSAAGTGRAPINWEWPGDVAGAPDSAPLQALILTATKLMGVYGQDSVRAAGLKVSLAGLGVLRVLMGEDGLKASEVADRAWSTPGTLTSVVNTLVRDGYVQRRADEGDRRVVRLYITGPGRDLITSYVSQAHAWWGKAFDFVDPADEAVVRRFFAAMIDHFSQLIREERGA